MPLPRRLRRTPDPETVRRQEMKQAVATLAKTLGVRGATIPATVGATATYGHGLNGGFNNLGNAGMAMMQRATQNMARDYQVPVAEIEAEMAEQGMSFGPPFSPGRPLDPFVGYRQPPRTWDYQVGENVQITPRANRVSFQTIKGIYDAYDVAQIAVRHLINDVRSLDYSFVPADGVRDDVSGEIDAARAFFEFPDKRLPFRNWLAEYLQDVLRYDAGSLYIRRSEDGTPVALEVIDGTTIAPLVDFYGRLATNENDEQPPDDGLWPGGNTPGFMQIIHGMPWVWLTADDVVYVPWNPLPESQYGLAPLEAVLLTANTDIRFQWHFLQYFTEGTIPAGFMEAPPDMSDPTQLAEWQETWDALMLGDQAKLRQVRWVPSGAKWTPVKDVAFDEKFPLYLMRRVVAAYGVTPNDLGFTESVNRATGDTQVDVQFRVGTTPLLRHVESVVNLFIVREFGWRARLRFDTGQETEDRLTTAQAHGVYIDKGVISTDEVRAELGKPIDRSRPMPRFIANPRVGAIPLIAIESMAGKIDEETYAPDKGQALIPNPYMPVPGVLPQMGTPELKAVSTASAQMGNGILRDTTGAGPTPEMQQAIDAASPIQSSSSSVAAAAGSAAADEPTAKAYLTRDEAIAAGELPKLLSQAMPGYGDLWVDDHHKKVFIAMGDGDGNDRVRAVIATAERAYPGYEVDQDAEALPSGDGWRHVYHGGKLVKDATAGLTAVTGVQGVDLSGHAEDDDEDLDEAAKAAEMALELRRWRENARNRIRKGKTPRRFNSTVLPADLVDRLDSRLRGASTRQEVDAVFADAAHGPFRHRSTIRRPQS